ncbi:MAG: hypothetical protein OHK0048_20210 [Rhodoferax sp.]
MNAETFWLTLGLVLVIEGFMPFVSPATWRRTFEQILRLTDGQLRFFGLCSLLLGMALVWFLGDASGA